MIPREIYTLGAVQFDTSKLANLQGQLMAKKAAKDEATEKYLFDLQGKVPTNQVRAVDRDKYQEKVSNWIKAGIAAKGQPGAQQQILTGFQELLADANESKAAGERQQKIAQLKLEDKIDALDFPTIENMSRSIYDPEFYKNPEIRQPYTIEDFSVNIPAWDVPKRKQFIDYAIGGMKPAGKVNIKTIEDPQSFTKTTTWDEVFDDNQMRAAEKKAIAITSDRSGLKTYSQILKEGTKSVPAPEFTQLADVYHKAHPDDLMDTPIKVAQADILLGMTGAKGTGKQTATDVRGRMAYGSRLISGRGGGAALPVPITGNAIDEIPDVNITDTKTNQLKGQIKNGMVYDTKGNFYNGDVAIGYEQLPQSLITVLEYNKIGLSPARKTNINVKDGVIQTLKQEGQPVINRQMIQNAQLKYNTETQKGQQPTFGPTKTPVPSAKKSYNIGGRSLTRAQLEAGAKKYNMSFSEYLKSLGINE